MFNNWWKWDTGLGWIWTVLEFLKLTYACLIYVKIEVHHGLRNSCKNLRFTQRSDHGMRCMPIALLSALNECKISHTWLMAWPRNNKKYFSFQGLQYSCSCSMILYYLFVSRYNLYHLSMMIRSMIWSISRVNIAMSDRGHVRPGKCICTCQWWSGQWWSPVSDDVQCTMVWNVHAHCTIPLNMYWLLNFIVIVMCILKNIFKIMTTTTLYSIF